MIKLAIQVQPLDELLDIDCQGVVIANSPAFPGYRCIQFIHAGRRRRVYAPATQELSVA